MLLEKSEIMNFLPQREPFLMVDRVVECDASKGIVAELDIPPTLPFFKGHFPGMPIMPGVMITESLAQTCGLLIALKRAGVRRQIARGQSFFFSQRRMSNLNRLLRRGEF